MCKSPRLALCEAGIEATGRDWPQSHIVNKDKVIILTFFLFLSGSSLRRIFREVSSLFLEQMWRLKDLG